MSDREERVDRALASLKRIDDERLGSLAGSRAAQALFEEVVAMDEQQPMPRKQGAGARRRTLLLRAGVAAAAVAALVGVLSVVNPFGSNGLTTVQQAAAALAPQQSVILHMKMLGRQTNPDGSVVTWSDESWQATEEPFDRRQIEIGPEGSRAETAFADGRGQLYEVDTNTVYIETPRLAESASSSTGTPSPKDLKVSVAPGPSPGTVRVKIAATNAGDTTTTTRVMSDRDAKLLLARVQGGDATPQVDDGGSAGTLDGETADPFRAEILAMLRSGTAVEEGRLSIDGREAIRLVATQRVPEGGAPGSASYIVDARTYDPIEWRTTGDGGGTILRFVVYEHLPNTASNRALLSLTEQHPGARIDRDPAHYQEASARLFPNG